MIRWLRMNRFLIWRSSARSKWVSSTAGVMIMDNEKLLRHPVGYRFWSMNPCVWSMLVSSNCNLNKQQHRVDQSLSSGLFLCVSLSLACSCFDAKTEASSAWIKRNVEKGKTKHMLHAAVYSTIFLSLSLSLARRLFTATSRYFRHGRRRRSDALAPGKENERKNTLMCFSLSCFCFNGLGSKSKAERKSNKIQSVGGKRPISSMLFNCARWTKISIDRYPWIFHRSLIWFWFLFSSLLLRSRWWQKQRAGKGRSLDNSISIYLFSSNICFSAITLAIMRDSEHAERGTWLHRESTSRKGWFFALCTMDVVSRQIYGERRKGSASERKKKRRVIKKNTERYSPRRSENIFFLFIEGKTEPG